MFFKKATKSWFEIYEVNVKSTVIFYQIVVAFLDNLNCTQLQLKKYL